jgi:hypothetical protein
MEIHEITQRKHKSKKLDEVNFGAIPGALAGIAKQAVTGQTTSAVPGQEQNVAYKVTDDLVKQQANSAYQTWQQAVRAKLQEFGVSDASKLSRREIETTLKNYVEQRLMAGQQNIDSLKAQPTITNTIRQTMETIVLNTLDNKWQDPTTGDAWMRLVKNLRMSQFQGVKQMTASGQVSGPAAGGGGITLNPQTLRIAQQIAPYTAQMARLLPTNYNSAQVPPTANATVNAILANLGLLKGYNPGKP